MGVDGETPPRPDGPPAVGQHPRALLHDTPSMADRTALTTVEDVADQRSYLFTAIDEHGAKEEVILVPCDGAGATDDVRAWINRCTHEAQRLDTGRGIAMRDGHIICPRHGSMFDSCTGDCDNGEAADTTLPEVEVVVDDGTVYLVDDGYTVEHEGGLDAGEDDDVGPGSTSHIGF
jgi:nitrite reductase/ring-hydroxylating ferredoxin subunit